MYKDEFSEGPYSSDINSSNDQWFTEWNTIKAIDRTVNQLINESNKNYKVMNDIPNQLKFNPNKNINGNKSKPIPVTSGNVRKGKYIQSVHATGL